MKGKGVKTKLYLLSGLCAVGMTLVTTGSYAILTTEGHTDATAMAVGTLKISESAGVTGCSSGNDASLMNTLPAFRVQDVQPGDDKQGATFTVVNQGSLDAWVGFTNELQGVVFTGASAIGITYSITVYQPNANQTMDSETDPDGNGDYHSNCHTGSKYRGAGGEDKTNDNDGDDPVVLQTLSPTTVSTSATVPQSPFLLPVGDYAIVNYRYHFPGSGRDDEQGKAATVKIGIDAVQVQNNTNVGAAGAVVGPVAWDPVATTP